MWSLMIKRMDCLELSKACPWCEWDFWGWHRSGNEAVRSRPIGWPRNRLSDVLFFRFWRMKAKGGDGFSTAHQLPLGLWENCQDLPMGLIRGVDWRVLTREIRRGMLILRISPSKPALTFSKSASYPKAMRRSKWPVCIGSVRLLVHMTSQHGYQKSNHTKCPSIQYIIRKDRDRKSYKLKTIKHPPPSLSHRSATTWRMCFLLVASMMESRLNPGKRTSSWYSCCRVCTSIVLSLAGVLLKKARPLVGWPSSP